MRYSLSGTSRSKAGLLPAASVLICLLAAATTPAWAWEWQKKGRLSIRTYEDTSDNSPYESSPELYTRLRLENDLLFREQDISLTFNAEGRYKSLLGEKNDSQGNLLVREAYVKLKKEHFSLSAGNQTVTWGKLDNFAVLDIINPQDYREFIHLNKQDRKEPQFMFKYDLFNDAFQLENIWMPFFKPSIAPFFNSDWAMYGRLKETIEGGSGAEAAKQLIRNIRVDDRDRFDDHNLKNSQGGMRLRGKAGEFDYSLYYMNLFTRIPVLREKTPAGILTKQFLNDPNDATLAALAGANPSQDDLTLESYHRRMNVIGADTETVWKDFGIRAEAGYMTGVPCINRGFSYAFKDTIVFGAGIDRTSANNLYVNFQFIETAVLDYEDMFGLEKYNHQATAKLTKDFLRGDLKFALETNYNLSFHDWMLNPEMTYAFNNGFEISLGGFIFEGGPQTLFGRYSTKDQVYLKGIYSF